MGQLNSGAGTLTLYITADSAASQRAVDCLDQIRGDLDRACQVLVLDVDEHAGDAERDHIMVTPSLVHHQGGRTRWWVGDFSNPSLVSEALGLAVAGE